jgi:ArsR family transcriptional regulator
MSKNAFLCDCHPIDEKLVTKVKDSLPDGITLQALVNLFATIGDNTRCKILFALRESPLCVCDLANVLSMTKSSVSHQLNKMKSKRIVKSERLGKQVFYSLDDGHILDILNTGIIHLHHKSEGENR